AGRGGAVLCRPGRGVGHWFSASSSSPPVGGPALLPSRDKKRASRKARRFWAQTARLSRLLFPLPPCRRPLLLRAPLAALVPLLDLHVLTPSDFDVDLTWLGPLTLGQCDRQHAMIVIGLDVVRLYRSRKCERPLESAVGALVAMDPFGPCLRLLLLAPMNREQIALERNLEVLGPDTGNLRTDADVVGLFKDIDRRHPGGGRAVAILPVQASPRLVEQALCMVDQIL